MSFKIAIDAKWYFDGPPSGKRVIKALVDNILMNDQKNKYIIVLNKAHESKEFPHIHRKNVSVLYAWAGNNLLSNIFVVPFLLRKEEIDLVVFQNFVSFFGKAKKIAYIHDVLFLSNPEFYTLIEKIYLYPIRVLTKFADSVFTISEEEKKRIIQYKVVSQITSVYVIYHGVEKSFTNKSNIKKVDLLSIQNKYNLPDVYLLYVGRLNVRKNIENLLKSISLLKNKEINLVIVGHEDWKSTDYYRIALDYGIASRIKFTGAVSNEDLPIIYSLGKIFCFPSLAEGFGLPPLEAMASGIPVVVSNTTCLPEICGDAGIYVNPLNPSDIAQKIDFTLINMSYYNEKVSIGYEISKKYTWTLAADRFIQSCLKSLCND